MLSAVVVMGFGLSSCGGKNLSCSEASQNLLDATQAWTQDQSTANCNALLDAYRDIINNSDCPGVTKDASQAALDALNQVSC